MMSGENKLQTAKEKLANFIKTIEEYSENTGVFKQEIIVDFETVNGIDLAVMESISQQDCFNYAYILYDYAIHIQCELSRQKVAFNWCENALNQTMTMIKDDYEPDFWKFTKHEMKAPTIAKDNSYVAAILSFKQVAEARIQTLSGLDVLTRKKAECLIEKGKRI